jgi:hypothetical protein
MVLAIIIGLYPLLYFFIDRNFGLLQSKSADLLLSIVWNTAFYVDIEMGGNAFWLVRYSSMQSSGQACIVTQEFWKAICCCCIAEQHHLSLWRINPGRLRLLLQTMIQLLKNDLFSDKGNQAKQVLSTENQEALQAICQL